MKVKWYGTRLVTFTTLKRKVVRETTGKVGRQTSKDVFNNWSRRCE